MEIRTYQPADCKEMAELFYQTVHTVNAKDYTRPQLDAWATGQVDLEQWDRSFLEHLTLVATENDRIAGFADMADDAIWTACMCMPTTRGKGSPLPCATGWSSPCRGLLPLTPPLQPSLSLKREGTLL